MSQGTKNNQTRKRKFNDSATNAENAESGDNNGNVSDEMEDSIKSSMTGRKRKCSDSNDNDRLVKLPKPSSPISGLEERASRVLASIKSATSTTLNRTCEIKDIDWSVKESRKVDSPVLRKDRSLDSDKCSRNVSNTVEKPVTPSTPSNSYKTKDSSIPTQANLLRDKINSKRGIKSSNVISASVQNEEVVEMSEEVAENIVPSNSENDHPNLVQSEKSTEKSPKKVPDDAFNKIISATASKWECAVCLIRNLESATKCACCGAPGPASASQEPAKPTTTPKFKFGLNNSSATDSQQPLQPTTAPKFNFGLNSSATDSQQPLQPTTAPKFNFGLNNSGTDSQQPLQPTTAPKFNFGLNNSSGTDSQQPLQPTTAPKFNFGLNKNSGTDSQQPLQLTTAPKFKFGLQNSSVVQTETSDIPDVISTAEDKSTTID